MAVYWKPEKGRWYFQFRKRIAGRQFSASKLLPKGWSRTQAEKYDRKECARLYALASGTEQPDFLIDDAIVRYIDEKCPTLANGKSRCGLGGNAAQNETQRENHVHGVRKVRVSRASESDIAYLLAWVYSR